MPRMAISAPISAAIRPEQCYLDWQECLEQLEDLVEPDIPG